MNNNVKFSVKNLNLYYGKFHALKGIDMDIPSNEVTAFIGPSGCGKSTFLKSLNRMNDLVEGCKITGDDPLKYEIEGEGVGAQGTYLVKVTVIQKKSKLDADVIKKCAVHGVLFKGFSSQTSRTRQKPLAGSMVVEQQHQDYFDVFFQKGGSYMNFANMVGENLSVVKMGKQYRISAVVSVAKDALYQELVSAGVIKGLNNGF